MEPQKFGMISNLVVGEALWFFEQNTRERVTETNANYKLFMKDMVTYLFFAKGASAPEEVPPKGVI